MPRTVRVKLSPAPTPEGAGTPAQVKGLVVSLLARGQGTSAGSSSPAPCTLTFHFGFREKLRDGSVPDIKKLASLEGTLELTKDGPVFTATQGDKGAKPLTYDPGADVGDPSRGEPRLADPVDETPPREEFPRLLELSFDDDTFLDMLDEEKQNQRLLVPAEPEGVHHLELFADLALGGAEEAALDVNDILDVPLTADCPPHNDGLRLILESADDTPIPEADFSIAFEDGTELEGKLNRDGQARVLDAPRGFFQVTYADHDDIRAKAMAGRIRKAAEARDLSTVLGVLGQSSFLLEKISAAYDEFFNDLGGSGMVADARKVTKGSNAEPWAEHLIATGELEGGGGGDSPQVFAMNERQVDPKEDAPNDEGTALA